MEELKYYNELYMLREQIDAELNDNRSKTAILTKLDEAMMWLNKYWNDYYSEERDKQDERN